MSRRSAGPDDAASDIRAPLRASDCGAWITATGLVVIFLATVTWPKPTNSPSLPKPNQKRTAAVLVAVLGVAEGVVE